MAGTPEPGLAFTEQAPASSIASITLGDAAPTAVWGTLADTRDFQEALVDAVLDAARDRTFPEVHKALEAAGVDALHGSYRSLILRTVRGDERAMWDLLRETRGLGTGRSAFEDILGAARLFGLAHEHTPDRAIPTVEVRVTHDFLDEVRADQRRAALELIATLARGCDVRLVATDLVTGRLAELHRDDLPGVSEACNTPPGGRGPVDELVSAARADLAPEGRKVRLLRALADEPSETLTFRELYADFSVGRDVTNDHVRGCLAALKDAGLVATFGPDRDRRVELLRAGRAFLETVDQEIGRQQRLDECVSETGKSCMKSRVPPPAHEAAPPGEDGPRPYVVRPMRRAHTAAAAAAAVDGGVTLVDHPLEAADDRRTHRVAYDEVREQAFVSVHGSGPFPYVVSAAVALASPRFIDQVLPVSRLEEIDVPPDILREASQIGWLSDEALDDGQVLRDALVEAGVKIQDQTRKFHHGEFDDACEFRGEIMQLAHGLAGAIVHLLKTVGVDLVREIRVPVGLDREKALEEMARSVAISAAIQARYVAFATYRQLFETRTVKRERALTPEVDAADPFGELIGSFVIRGSDLHRIEGYLTDALDSPAAIHEDAPEIAIRIPVAHADHRAPYALAVRRLCAVKNLDATREAVSLFQAFTSSPYAVTRALERLDSEDGRREIHLDEVRLALSTLPADRILPDAAPTVSQAVHALLTAAGPLTQAELAERAGVSARSVRTHADRLEAFGFVEATEAGYRLALPFRDERNADHQNVLPWYVFPNRERDDDRDATEKGVLAEAVSGHAFEGAAAVIEAMSAIETLQLPPAVRQEVVEIWPWTGPLLDAVRAIAAEEVAVAESVPSHRVGQLNVTFGAEIEQTSLLASMTTGEVTPAGAG